MGHTPLSNNEAQPAFSDYPSTSVRPPTKRVESIRHCWPLQSGDFAQPDLRELAEYTSATPFFNGARS